MTDDGRAPAARGRRGVASRALKREDGRPTVSTRRVEKRRRLSRARRRGTRGRRAFGRRTRSAGGAFQRLGGLIGAVCGPRGSSGGRVPAPASLRAVAAVG